MGTVRFDDGPGGCRPRRSGVVRQSLIDRSPCSSYVHDGGLLSDQVRRRQFLKVALLSAKPSDPAVTPAALRSRLQHLFQFFAEFRPGPHDSGPPPTPVTWCGSWCLTLGRQQRPPRYKALAREIVYRARWTEAEHRPLVSRHRTISRFPSYTASFGGFFGARVTWIGSRGPAHFNCRRFHRRRT